ncbi:MAG: metal-sensitive transcriptional regulator [Desulfotomaculales bacterium]
MTMADVREEVVRRLHNVQGHVAGLARMVEKGEECPTVLYQLAAIRSALYKITEMVLVIYAEDCLEKLPQENQGDRSSAQELVHLLCQFLK